MDDDKVRENRLRRMAQRQGLGLMKSRRRDPRAVDYGLWWIYDERNVIATGHSYGLTLDEVEKFLTGD